MAIVNWLGKLTPSAFECLKKNNDEFNAIKSEQALDLFINGKKYNYSTIENSMNDINIIPMFSYKRNHVL